MHPKVITAEQVRQHIAEKGYAAVKYVRVGDGFRFAFVLDSPDHADMLVPGEQATSAANAAIHGNTISIQGYSDTLLIGPALDDKKLLTELLCNS